MKTPLDELEQASYLRGYMARDSEQEFMERVLNTQTMSLWILLSFMAGMLFTHFVLR